MPAWLIEAWRGWIGPGLRASQDALGERWREVWLSAPVWFFHADRDVFGPAAVAGLWFPSVDQSGRYYPMMLAAALVAPDADGDVTELEAWLRTASGPALSALAEDWTPDELATALGALPGPAHVPASGAAMTWWTDGGPTVPPARFTAPALGAAGQFVSMLVTPDPEPMAG